MGKSRTKAELEAENRLLKQARGAQGIVSVINNVVKWGVFAWIFYCADHIVASLAGKTTSSNIAFSFITDLKMNQFFSYVIGGGGVVYGLSQRSLRRKTTERLHGRIQELETRIDPGRSSSKLTRRGETRPEDGK